MNKNTTPTVTEVEIAIAEDRVPLLANGGGCKASIISLPSGSTPAGNGETAAEYPLADFLEAVTYTWFEDQHEVRQALECYSESTHADY